MQIAVSYVGCEGEFGVDLRGDAAAPLVELNLEQLFALVGRDDVEVLHRGLDFAVAEDLVQDGEIATAPEPVDGEAVPELVRVAGEVLLCELPGALPRDWEDPVVEAHGCGVQL